MGGPAKEKPIEFKYNIDDGFENAEDTRFMKYNGSGPIDCYSIVFLYQCESNGYDVMLASECDGAEPMIVYGHWNDGIV